MTSKEIIRNYIDSLMEQKKIEKKCNSGLDVYCEIEITRYNQVLKDLEELEELKKIMGTPIQDISKKLKNLEYYENEQYKHWNIFFNGAKLEYLLYLEKKGKESFMTSISEELYSKIHKHFLE